MNNNLKNYTAYSSFMNQGRPQQHCCGAKEYFVQTFMKPDVAAMVFSCMGCPWIMIDFGAFNVSSYAHVALVTSGAK
jgi:hypothetical protein